MNFSDVLFPEIILQKRGPKNLIATYQEMLPLLDIENNGLLVHRRLQDLNDHNFVRHLYITKLCLQNKFKTYHVGADFLQALSSIDRDIPLDAFPENFCAYISFAKNQIKDDDGYVEGALVYIGRAASQIFPGTDKGKRCLFICYLNQRKELGYLVGNLAVCLEDFTKLNEVMNGYTTVDSGFGNKWEVDQETVQMRNQVYRTVVNTVLYIHSEDPKIELASTYVKGGRVSKNELKRTGKVINECTIPIIFVHRLYARKRSYNVDSSFVESYPRWQRCGPNLSKIKLVWVSEHIRTYQKSEAETAI